MLSSGFLLLVFNYQFVVYVCDAFFSKFQHVFYWCWTMCHFPHILELSVKWWLNFQSWFAWARAADFHRFWRQYCYWTLCDLNGVWFCCWCQGLTGILDERKVLHMRLFVLNRDLWSWRAAAGAVHLLEEAVGFWSQHLFETWVRVLRCSWWFLEVDGPTRRRCWSTQYTLTFQCLTEQRAIPMLHEWIILITISSPLWLFMLLDQHLSLTIQSTVLLELLHSRHSRLELDFLEIAGKVNRRLCGLAWLLGQTFERCDNSIDILWRTLIHNLDRSIIILRWNLVLGPACWVILLFANEHHLRLLALILLLLQNLHILQIPSKQPSRIRRFHLFRFRQGSTLFDFLDLAHIYWAYRNILALYILRTSWQCWLSTWIELCCLHFRWD